MSFNAIQRSAEPDETVDAGPDDAERAAAAERLAGGAPVAAEELVASLAPAAETPGPAAEAAPDSFDDELASVAVGRDIHAEAVAPPTSTEAEAERAADPAAVEDPTVADAAAPAGPDSDSPSAEPAGAATEDEDKPFVLDEEELRGYGLQSSRIDEIRGLTPEKARDVVMELRAKHADIGAEKERRDGIEEGFRKRAAATGGGGGLFGSLASMFAPDSPEQKAIKEADRNIAAAQGFLSDESVRDRIHRLRRQEIVDSANELSSDVRRLSAASAAFNEALGATPAGQAIEAEIASIMERHPQMSRNEIIAASKDGSLAAKIGDSPLVPLAAEAFQVPSVREAYATVDAVGDTIEKRGAALASRLKAYEEHFPGAVDGEKLQEVVDDAMKGLLKVAQEPIVEDPESQRKLSERLAEFARKIAEFFQKLFAKMGFGPKP